MALIVPQFVNSVVSIGRGEGEEYQSLATGFLAGFLNGNTDSKGNKLYTACLVTNRHVFDKKEKAILRFNVVARGTKTYTVLLKDQQANRLWMVHADEKVDLAVLPINFNLLINEGINCVFISEEHMAFRSTVKEDGIVAGDFIYVLGFPLGIVGRQQNYVVVRGGVIARIDDEVIQSQHAFLIDSTVFPGNSGGPVFLKPELVSIEGTKAVSKSYLLGIVSSYIPYRDACVSQQTGEARIVFVENSGLSYVVPMDFVRETIEPFIRHQKEKVLQQQTKEASGGA